jgi:3-hydroxybutyryl-CoA dehydratase
MKQFCIGQKASISKTITMQDIEKFADLTGDINPLHIDIEYCKERLFKKPIAHGMLVASLISNAIGNNLPGKGSIYLNQVLKFALPVFPDDTITATVVIDDIDNDKNIIKLLTNCKNQDGKLVITGNAVVLFKEM